MKPERIETTGARADVVNRTHRLVRERAAAIQHRRRETRDLVLPLLICSAVLLLVGYAAWEVFTQNGFRLSALEEDAGRLFNLEVNEAEGTESLLLLWFAPVSFVALALAYFGSRFRGTSSARAGR